MRETFSAAMHQLFLSSRLHRLSTQRSIPAHKTKRHSTVRIASSVSTQRQDHGYSMALAQFFPHQLAHDQPVNISLNLSSAMAITGDTGLKATHSSGCLM